MSAKNVGNNSLVDVDQEAYAKLKIKKKYEKNTKNFEGMSVWMQYWKLMNDERIPVWMQYWKLESENIQIGLPTSAVEL